MLFNILVEEESNEVELDVKKPSSPGLFEVNAPDLSVLSEVNQEVGGQEEVNLPTLILGKQAATS